jgi:hypothetical protein
MGIFAGGFAAGTECKIPGMITWLMPVAAILLARAQQPEFAAELLSLSFHYPQSAPGRLAHWSPIEDLGPSLRQALGEERYQQAWERGKELDLKAGVTTLLEALPTET